MTLNPLIKASCRVPFLTLIVWAILYIPRISTLGFYYGDSWATIVAISHGRFHTYGSLSDLLIQFAPKPVAIFVHLLFVYIAGDSTRLWQAGLALACLAGALILNRFFAHLSAREDQRYNFTADISTALWLAMPLDLGATVLPNMFNAIVGQAMFFGYGLILIRMCGSERISRRDLLISALLLIGSYLSYEAYYLQFIVFFALIFFLQSPRPDLKRVCTLLTFSTGLQAVCILYNRTIGFIDPAKVGSKAFNAAWRDTINYEALSNTITYNLAHALADFRIPVVYCVQIIITAACVACIYAAFRKNFRPIFILTAGYLVVLSCYLLAATIYALAGYGLTYMGIESRVAMVPVFLFAIAAFVSLVVSRRWIITGIVAHGAGVALVVVMALLAIEMVKPWKTSWNLQRKVLKQLDQHKKQLTQLTPSSCVVFIGPYYVGPVPVFQADIQLTIAVKEKFKRFQAWEGLDPYFLSVYNGHRISFTDGSLVQYTPGGHEQRRSSPDTWVWNYFTKEFRRMENGESFDPAQLGVIVPVKRK